MKVTFGFRILILFIFLGCANHSKNTTIINGSSDKNLSNLKWDTGGIFKNPESTYYDEKLDILFVSNMPKGPMDKSGSGYIATLSTAGELLSDKWFTGLNAPKGMISDGKTLWVSDINEVVSIDIKTQKIINKVLIPGSKFLNDLALDHNGAIFVSDLLTGIIHVVQKKSQKVFINNEKLENPNGLYYHNGHLYVAAWGSEINQNDFSTKTKGKLLKINLKNRKITEITKPLGNLDGLERISDGSFVVSDWMNGSIYQIKESGEVNTIYQAVKGSADIGHIKKLNLITIPMMLEGNVQAIQL
jgi:hypothetical protein